MATQAKQIGKKRYRMFIDDTGNVTRTKSKHQQARYSGVTGVIFELDYLRSTFEPGLLSLKKRHFGLDSNGVPHRLHLRKMKSYAAPFDVLRDEATRLRWQKGCFSMYRRAQYDVISIGADKEAFYAKHPLWDKSMYAMLGCNAFERYVYFLRNRNGVGDVMAESINTDLDKEIKDAYRNFFEHGAEYMPPNVIQKVLTTKEIKIEDKKADAQGLQIADLLAATCLAHIRNVEGVGDPIQDEFAKEVASLLEIEKFYRSNNGNPAGYGRVWRP